MDINVVSSFVANYIKNAWMPSAIEDHEKDQKLTDGEFLHIEKAILSGRGLPTNKRDFSGYVFNVGGAQAMVPTNRLKSEEMLMFLPKTYIHMVPQVSGASVYLPDVDDDDIHIVLNTNDVIIKKGPRKGQFDTSAAASLLAHEFRHAMDHYLSKGNAPFYSRVGDVTDTSEYKDYDSPYYLNQTEANARFAQVENRLINKLRKEKNNEQYTKDKYIEDIKKHFADLHIRKGDMKFTNSEKQYRRFVNRALDLYREMKG
jgi:hypothetical protein